MPSRRPSSATAAGVMAILYGSVLTLCGLCGVAGSVAQGALGNNLVPGNDPMQVQMQEEMKAALERDVPGYEAFQAVSTVLGLAIALLILIAGIGILNLRHWARTLALVGCLIAIAATLAQAIFQAAYVLPAMNQAFQVVLPAAMPQAAGPQGAKALMIMETMMTVIAVVMVIVYVVIAIYLGIIVLLLCRRQVRAAFARERSGLDDEGGLAERGFDEGNHPGEHEDDNEWHRPRRGGRSDGREE